MLRAMARISANRKSFVVFMGMCSSMSDAITMSTVHGEYKPLSGREVARGPVYVWREMGSVCTLKFTLRLQKQKRKNAHDQGTWALSALSQRSACRCFPRGQKARK